METTISGYVGYILLIYRGLYRGLGYRPLFAVCLTLLELPGPSL